MVLSSVLAGFAVGLALAGAPGPVQVVLMSEAVRGGIGRGFRALVGANLTFGALLVALAMGLSVSPPRGTLLRALQIGGGALLVWLSIDAARSRDHGSVEATKTGLHPSARGALAVVINPGGWLFLGAVASPLFASAVTQGATSAVPVALALMSGLALGDAGVVLLGGLGVRRAGRRTVRVVRAVLAGMLGVSGLWLIATGATP